MREYLAERQIKRAVAKMNRWAILLIVSCVTGFVLGHIVGYIKL